MRVAYVLTWSGGASTGVFKKVGDQVAAWHALGVEAGVFVATTSSGESDWLSLPETKRVVRFDNAPGSVLAQRELLTASASWSPDMTYVRTTPRQAFAARQLRAQPHVIEIQTNDLAEAAGISRKRLWLSQATRRSCHGAATGLVFVSSELAALPSYSMFTHRRVVIGNGIDLDRITALPASNTGGAPTLAFMGQANAKWHGLEDIFDLARARPEWTIDLIGPTATGQTPRLANLNFHGEMSSAEYRPILAKADAALSTLAWYRSSMSEASPLKSREYLALGLPVIGAYEDTDIPDGNPIYLRLPNRAGSLVNELARVESFINQWRGRRVTHDEIRFLDTSVKETQRIHFLRECANA